MRETLNNYFYATKAKQINDASEVCDIEKEFNPTRAGRF